MKTCKDCGSKNVGLYCTKCGADLYTNKKKNTPKLSLIERFMGYELGRNS